MEFLNSLKKRSKHYGKPFSHWELNEPLTQDAIKEICETEITELSKNNSWKILEFSKSAYIVNKDVHAWLCIAKVNKN